MVRSVLAALLMLAASAGARADSLPCVVADPTGTPLNVRSTPAGTIVGTLSNGKLVYTLETATSGSGKRWTEIGDQATRTPIGWVLSDFIRCAH